MAKFTDEQLMLYVDGDIDSDTAASIEKASSVDKELMDRIETFKIANNAMLHHVHKTSEMPEDFYEQLKRMERNKPLVSQNDQSIMSKLLDQVKNFNLFPAGLATAAVAAFGVFVTSQIQITKNENLAKNFFADLQETKQYSEQTEISKPILIANVREYDKLTVLRSKEAKEPLLGENVDINPIDPNLKISFSITSNENIKCDFPSNGYVSVSTPFSLKTVARENGKFGLLYVNSALKTQIVVQGLGLSKNEERVFDGRITEPIGKEFFQFVFEKEEPSITNNEEKRKVDTATFNLNIIGPKNTIMDLSNDHKFIKKPLSIFSKSISLGQDGISITSSSLKITEFGKDNFSNADMEPSIWKQSKKIYVDLTNNGFSNLILLPKKPGSYNNIFVVDRNDNQKPDAIIKTFKINERIFYQWFLDENEDGFADLISNDCDGNWKVDQIFLIK